MNDVKICGYGEHSRFDAVKNGNLIEFSLIGATETICICRDKDGNVKAHTMQNSYIEKCIQEGQLTPHQAEEWYIQRDEDKYYFTGSRWSPKIANAMKFPNNEIDGVLRVCRDRNYKAQKIVV